LFVLLVAGLILSLVGVVVWRGEQQVDAENFRLAFSLSMLGAVIFGVLLIVAVLYLRRKK
jgi:Tfp pilus assembly protein PilN